MAMSTADDELELRIAEMAATGGPAFELWRAADDARTLVLSQFDTLGVRHIVAPDGLVIVHAGDRSVATTSVERLAGPDLEATATLETPPGDIEYEDLSGVDLVTVYTAGDLVTAEVIKARLRADGLTAVLRYDPTLGMARHLTLDATVRVQVPVDDEHSAREALGGVDLDEGSADRTSRAWSSPARRFAATGLLVFVAIWGLGLVVLILAILSDIFS